MGSTAQRCTHTVRGVSGLLGDQTTCSGTRDKNPLIGQRLREPLCGEWLVGGVSPGVWFVCLACPVACSATNSRIFVHNIVVSVYIYHLLPLPREVGFSQFRIGLSELNGLQIPPIYAFELEQSLNANTVKQWRGMGMGRKTGR
jgi:hypothetical protein